MNLTGMTIRLLHSLVDRILGVDRTHVLNAEKGVDTSDGDISVAMRTVIDELKIEGFDTERGKVDYDRLKGSSKYEHYKQIAARLRAFDPSSLESRAEKLAFWINLYNSLIVDAVIALGIKDSVWEAGRGFFRKVAYNIGGLRYSSDDIEHGILRGNRRHRTIPMPQFAPGDPRLRNTITPIEPRIHFTLVCASRSCPLITVYHAPDIEEELEIAANSFVNGGGVIVKPEERRVSLSRIFKWYQRDFGGRSGVIEVALRYLREGSEKDFLRANVRKVRIGYQEYDWALNRH